MRKQLGPRAEKERAEEFPCYRSTARRCNGTEVVAPLVLASKGYGGGTVGADRGHWQKKKKIQYYPAGTQKNQEGK